MSDSFLIRPLAEPVEQGAATVRAREWFDTALAFDDQARALLDKMEPGAVTTVAGTRVARSVTYGEDWDASTLEAEILMEQSRLRVALHTRHLDAEHRRYAIAMVREVRGLQVRLQEAYAREQAEEDSLRHQRYEDESGR